MKRKISILLSIIVVFVGLCIFFTNIKTNGEKIDIDTTKLNIVTSFYPMYIATSNIVDGVDDVTLSNLTNTEVGCLHDYQLTTQNMVLLDNADIFIINGGGMESFIDKALNNHEELKIINASSGMLKEEWNEETQNSHAWVSISKHIIQVQNIRDELCKIDEVNKEKYIENANAYIQKLETLRDNMHEALDKIENKNVVTFHEAFYYFAEEFGLNVVAVIEREPGTSPSAGELAEIIDTIESVDAKAIFVEPQYQTTAANTISNETNIPVYNLDPIVTGKLYKEAYIDIMNKNLKTLLEALKDGE